MDFLTFFGIYLTPKLPKYIILLPFEYNVSQKLPIDLNSSRFVSYVPSFILVKLFPE